MTRPRRLSIRAPYTQDRACPERQLRSLADTRQVSSSKTSMSTLFPPSLVHVKCTQNAPPCPVNSLPLPLHLVTRCTHYTIGRRPVTGGGYGLSISPFLDKAEFVFSFQESQSIDASSKIHTWSNESLGAGISVALSLHSALHDKREFISQ